MIAFVTSCGRFDLLQKTLISFQDKLQHKPLIIINEDNLSKMGQHASIELFLKSFDCKYYIHLEEDWEFDNNFDWIKASIDIMENNPNIIKVLCRKDSQHPCVHDKELKGIKYGLLNVWHHEGITWNGFSWNPGVTRFDLLKKFIPFRKWEGDVAEDIANAGYKVAELEKKIYKHLGYGRSTHE